MAYMFGDAAKVEWCGDGKPVVAIYATDSERSEPYGVITSMYQDDTVDRLHRVVQEVRQSVDGFRLYV